MNVETCIILVQSKQMIGSSMALLKNCLMWKEPTCFFSVVVEMIATC